MILPKSIASGYVFSGPRIIAIPTAFQFGNQSWYRTGVHRYLINVHIAANPPRTAVRSPAFALPPDGWVFVGEGLGLEGDVDDELEVLEVVLVPFRRMALRCIYVSHARPKQADLRAAPQTRPRSAWSFDLH